jgi:hypothetical protein
VAPAGKTYETWIIDGNKITRDALFSGGGRVLVPVHGTVPSNAVVAVTLERAGGVDAPTSTPLVASHPV